MRDKATVTVKHVGDDDYVVTKITDPVPVLPAWVKKGVDLSAAQCVELNAEYGDETVQEEDED